MKAPVAIALAVVVMTNMLLAQSTTAAKAAPYPDLQQLQRMIARLSPTDLTVDTSQLSAGDVKAIVKLIEAARVVNDIFITQLWSGNQAEYARLKKDTSPLGRARLHYFWINKSPWSDLDGHIAFIPGVPERKPLGANFYPLNMSKEEFESWVATLPQEKKEDATGFYSVIRESKAANENTLQLINVPYSQEYKSDLERAANLLKEAAALTENASLKKFLNSRADAFLSNDYYQSDLDWMDLDAPLDITIGPYETYNDEIFGYKAAFEAYINVRDKKETAKLGFFAKHLQEIENNLPIDPKYRNPKIGGAAPIRVVNEVFGAGDGNHGVQTAAYNLPNDERVVALKGSKRVMLKNVQEAKFKKILLPISKLVLAPEERGDVSFDAFFTHIVAHELMHGLGPQQITLNGRATSPRKELKELYSAIEEAKADVTGLYALQYLLDHGNKVGIDDAAEETGERMASAISREPDARAQQPAHGDGVAEPSKKALRKLYTTYLASAFRTLRFGTTEAHGKGMAMQMNYILDKGGFVARPNGTFAVDFAKIKDAVHDLDHDLLTLEATGNYAGAKKMMEELGIIRPVVKKAIAGMSSIPTDIEPVFVTAEALTPGSK